MDAPRPGKPSHRLASRFVVRTPVLPLDTLAALADPDLGVVRAALRRLLDDPGVREAMFVASPELATQVEAWHQAAGDEDPAIERTILRYVSRMAGRATPFGLFSGVAVGAFAPQTALTLGARAAHGRHTRLDNDYLFKLCDQLLADAAVRRELRFVPNSSLYRVGDRWRYANGRIGEAGRSYFLVAVESTPYLEELLTRAAAGATLGELGDVLAVDPELTRAEIDEFLDELVAAQVVVPTLQPRVTGPEPGHVMIELLGALPSARHVATTLADVTRRIAAIDEARGAPAAAYRELGAALGALPVEVDLARLFQVDLHLTAPPMTLGPRVAAELTRGFELLRKLSPPPNKTNDAWTKFREAFSARYETREVPLVEALDEESGIGFASAPSDTAQAPLIADLAFPNQAGVGQVPWAGRNARLLTLLANALARGAAEVELSDKDVEALSSPPGPLADTFTIGATVIAASAAAVDAGDFQLRVDHFGNASAARLYGRFCHGNDEITALVGELTALEQQANPDVIFAEIVHLPEGRIGNILLRPVLRGYEIPYLGTSGADADHQVAITDLMVSVVGDRVVLRSRRLGKEIRPELATAHNYSARSLVIYRFLCAHATQHTTGGTWSWGPALEDAPFLPRVRHGKLILERARWLLRRVDLEPLEQAAKGAKAAKTPAQLAELRAREIAAAHALRARRGLPRWVVVADGDNELPVDFDNPLSVEGFANLLKGRPMAILHELLPGPDELAVHGPEGGHVHELMAAFVRDAPAPVASRTVAAPSTIARRFAPGSTWLYAKLYGGTSSCEAALREVVAPLVTEVFGAGLAEQFFFIRYTDPEHHLRLRFRGEPQRLLGEVLPRLAARLEPAMARGLVWRFQLDTYEREVERYGGDHGIELSEALFAADSEAVLAIVEATPGDDGAAARWRLAARGLDTLLGDLGMTIPERLALMTSVRDSFGAEVGMEVTFQRRLGDKFRAHRAELAALLAAPADDAEHPLSPGLIALARRSERLVPIVTALRGAALTTSWAGLASSYAHMHVNRMLANAQRRQELVLYDLLRRHYDGVLARQKANARRQ
jgi:thiopeptide-type bacteriocin biosynthesis protein